MKYKMLQLLSFVQRVRAPDGGPGTGSGLRTEGPGQGQGAGRRARDRAGLGRTDRGCFRPLGAKKGEGLIN